MWGQGAGEGSATGEGVSTEATGPPSAEGHGRRGHVGRDKGRRASLGDGFRRSPRGAGAARARRPRPPAGRRCSSGSAGRRTPRASPRLGARRYVYDLVPVAAGSTAQLSAIKALRGVLYVEPDYPVYATGWRRRCPRRLVAPLLTRPRRYSLGASHASAPTVARRKRRRRGGGGGHRHRH